MNIIGEFNQINKYIFFICTKSLFFFLCIIIPKFVKLILVKFVSILTNITLLEN